MRKYLGLEPKHLTLAILIGIPLYTLCVLWYITSLDFRRDATNSKMKVETVTIVRANGESTELKKLVGECVRDVLASGTVKMSIDVR